ncbi:MAG: branched-chain amino acid aminotransferase [Desulfatitalea sp.]|nr:aminotransferase class IV [Desulfatitalea sp.]NNJ99880.1 branched-chain amino acid aminotransferase [Desulfatitalea sp.]
MPVYYVDGDFLPAEKAVIPVDDLAVVRGIGVFDLLRTYGGKPLFIKEHVARLFESARQINLTLPWSQAHVCATAIETLKRNTVDEANIRIIATGGSSSDFITPAGRPRLIVMVTPLPEAPRWWYEKGVKVITLITERRIPGAKSIDYIPAAMALSRAQAQGAVDAVYVDRNGNALEGTTSNLFAVIDDRLVTAGRGILAGVTRRAVIDLAAELLPVDIRDLPLAELLTAQEVFLTGTNKGLLPVVQVDDTTIADGVPGPRTRRIMKALATLFIDSSGAS